MRGAGLGGAERGGWRGGLVFRGAGEYDGESDGFWGEEESGGGDGVGGEGFGMFVSGGGGVGGVGGDGLRGGWRWWERGSLAGGTVGRVSVGIVGVWCTACLVS